MGWEYVFRVTQVLAISRVGLETKCIRPVAETGLMAKKDGKR